MSKFIGRRVNVGVGKETTRGTGVSATFWIPHSALSFYDRVTKAYPNEAIGSISLAPTTAIPALRWAEGDFEGEINANSFGLILLALFGTVNSAAILSAYDHTYTLQEDNQHDSLSVYQITPDETILFELSMINSLEIRIEMGEIVKFTVGFLSKASATSTETKSYARDYKFVSRDLQFKVADTTGDIASASKISLKSLTLKIEKNVEKDHILGSFDPEDILNKGIDIRGSAELNYEDNTWKNYMLNGNVKALQIFLENTRQTIGTTHPQLTIQFPKVEFSEWEPAYGIDDIVKQSINFSVLYDINNDRLFSSIVLRNPTVSY